MLLRTPALRAMSALTLAPPELFYALPHECYLAAICGLRIRSRERSIVDAAFHQVLERPRLPALKKSTCMVEYAPEESVGWPFVVGMWNRKFVWSRGTGYW